jgi:hypothetical protein
MTRRWGQQAARAPAAVLMLVAVTSQPAAAAPGWYLAVPPPHGTWQTLRAFDTAAECEAWRPSAIDTERAIIAALTPQVNWSALPPIPKDTKPEDVGDALVGQLSADPTALALARSMLRERLLRRAVCIASDDPRLTRGR